MAAGAPGRGGAREVPGAGARRRGLAGTSEYERRLCRLELELTGLRLRNEELQAIISQLEASRDDYASLFDTAPVGYVILDESGSVQRVNQHFALLLGHKPGWLLDGPFARLVAKADLHTFLEHLRECKHTRKRAAAEVSLRTSTGRFIPVELVSVPLEPDPGEPLRHLRTAVIDIRDRRAAEEELAQTQRDYQMLIDSVQGIVWEADARTLEISFVSRSAQRILGYPLERWFQPGFWAEHIYVEDRERVLDTMAKAVAEAADRVLEYRLITHERRVMWVRDTISLHRGNDRLKLCGVAVDITDRKEAEQELRLGREQLEARVAERTAELREMVAELEAFSYSLSHDMRAPLRAMQGYSQLLVNRFGDSLGATGRDYLNRVMEGTERLDRLVQDVLQYSKVTRAPLELAPVNLEKLVEDILRDYPALQPPKAEIEIKTPLLPVRGHQAFLTQCISNLLGNAVKFVRPGHKPRVQVWTRRLNGAVELCVQDNGIGIGAEDQKRIFGMFERVHSTRRFAGTGIGLAIVQKAVERMGGKVGVESALGQGSKFWLQLQRGGPE